ncbi:MAG: TauD/TfdA family dioxygenase [Pyrinomonadaceae bacterium]
MKNWIIAPLDPFGAIVRPPDRGESIDGAVDAILDLISKYRLVVFRGFALLDGEAFPEFCQGFGEAQEWDFGVINTLRCSPDAKNYLYTNREVPFHWDGAFVGQIPSFIIFHCDAAPDPASGGETLFSDTTLMLGCAPSEMRERWRAITITYTTEKIVHYGGTFTSPLIGRDASECEVIRYAEPVADLNPVGLQIDGIDASEYAPFLQDMHTRLNDKAVCYVHQWQDGDLVIADNHTLLHGRRAFNADTRRLIRRVNIL